MFQTGNLYSPMDYMNEYNKTGMLHLKYKTMNDIEVPQMNFAKRQDKLDKNIINNFDLNDIIKTNNIKSLENISGYLIYQEIKEEDFEDPNLPKLLKTFQYALEYLNAKQNKLVKTNEKLHLEYEQLINQSYEIEKKLKINKKNITKNKNIKKEHELLLLTYESLVNFNCNPTENTNIIMKNIKSNFDTNEYDKNFYEKNNFEKYQKNARFYCHICNGKYFNTEIGLENHMKRRHLAQIRQNSQKEKEEMKIEEIQDLYDKKLEETKNYFQKMLVQKNELLSKANLEEEISMMKKENDEKFKLMIENNKNITEEVGNMLKEYKIQQNEYNKNLINIANAAKENNENNNIPTKIKIENPNEINKFINSIDNLRETIEKKENNNAINSGNNTQIKMLEELNKKVDNLNLNQNHIKYDYNMNYKINNNNDINDINNNKTINEPQNTLIDINKINNTKIEDKNENNENQIKIDENNNINNNEEKNVINKINDPNNIISQGDFMSNNYNNYKESMLEQNIKESALEIPRVKNENNQNEEKETKLINLNNIEIIPNNDSNNNILKNIENNIPINNNNNINTKEIGIKQENYIKEQNESYNKTDPNAFKLKERDLNINDINDDINNINNEYQPLKTFSKNNNNDKLNQFIQNFKNRDNPIIYKNNEDKNENDIIGFTKEIIEEKNLKNDNMSEKVENFIENNAEEKNFEKIRDLDKKSEGELLDIIQKTLNNINKINDNSTIARLYFETMNKMIDFKMIENEEKMMRDAYNQRGELKKTRIESNAKKVIEDSEKDFDNI